MQLERTTKKSNKTTVIAQMGATSWKGTVTLTAETSAEYFQVRMTADEARKLAAQLLAMIEVA